MERSRRAERGRKRVPSPVGRGFMLSLVICIAVSGVGLMAAGAAQSPRQPQCPDGTSPSASPSPSPEASPSPCPTPDGSPASPSVTPTTTETTSPTTTPTEGATPTETGGTGQPTATTTSTATATTTTSPGPTVTVTGSPIPGKPQCSDGFDNDGDGKTDFPADPGCDNANDTNEVDGEPNPSPSPQPPACSDGLDNDNDGRTDFPADPGCSSAQDGSEAGPGGGGDGGRNRLRVDARVNIKHEFAPVHRFKGRIKSRWDRCEDRRRVVVRRAKKGRDEFIGRDRTNRRGKWKLPHDFVDEGRYYAIAQRKKFRNNGRRVICTRDRSRRIFVTS